MGIDSGVPSARHDIRLGDVVVSSPTPRHGGLIQYDFGKAVQHQDLVGTGCSAKPPTAILSVLSRMSSKTDWRGSSVTKMINELLH